MTPHDQAIADLVADGWREYPNFMRKTSRCFFKRYETPTRCFGNSDKFGAQIMISVSRGIICPDDSVSMEMEMTAGLKDETWVTLLNYSLPKTVPEVLALIPRMLRGWEAMNGK